MGIARPLGVAFWLTLAAMALAVVGDIVALQVGPAMPRHLISEGGQLAGYVIAIAGCAAASARSPRGGIRQAWTWMAVAFASSAVAEGIFGYLVTFQGQENPFPSLADPFYLLFYPLMAVGVSRLPAGPATGSQRLALALDAFIVAGSLLSASWFFLIGPTFFQGADSPSTLALSLAYPVGDLVLLLALTVLTLRGFDKAYRPVYLFLALGMLVTIYADSVYGYLNLRGTYSTGLAWVDPFWPAGALLMALAPLYQLARFDRVSFALARMRGPGGGAAADSAPSDNTDQTLARIVLPSIGAVLLAGLVWLAQFPTTDPRLLPTLEILVLIVVGLIIARQVLTLWENARLTRQQADALAKLAQANGRIAEYAHQLEDGIQHLSAAQARIAQGDFSARVPVPHGSLLFPVAAMLNLMLDRFQSRTQQASQPAPPAPPAPPADLLGQLALSLAQVCQVAEAGSPNALQALAQPSGTPLDAVARLLLRQQERIQALEARGGHGGMG